MPAEGEGEEAMVAMMAGIVEAENAMLKAKLEAIRKIAMVDRGTAESVRIEQIKRILR